ncbi:MAG: arginine--tRNA ligase [Parcubacteria group bacterium]
MKKELEKIIQKTVKDLFDIEEAGFAVEYPKDEKFGDYATNAALVLAKKVGKSPMEIAENLKSQIASLKSGAFGRIEVAPPGYINFYLSEKFLQDKVLEIQKRGEDFGKSAIGKGIKINNEFISANPTGPLHLGNARGGFQGDSISKILKKAGFEVTNEYYINDAGEQVMKLGHSVLKDSEAAYAGDYIDKLNKKFGSESDLRLIGEKSTKIIIDEIIKKTIEEKMKINFDIWMSEKSLYDDGYVDKVIARLKDKGITYEQEDALWLRTTDFGDDKDRVLVKGDGQKTYFASDCGYILNKIERGFDRFIETWGADHHGYINRFQAAAEALGFQRNNLKFIIVQLVRLVKNGKEVRMSKRAGNVVYIDELIEKVGHDVTRFFFLMYSPDTHMNFDLGLAEERSQKNPVFYVQYAHARICSILRKAEDAGMGYGADSNDLSLLTDEKELGLVRELNKFPELVEELAQSYEVHKLPYYAIKLADKFHSFYNGCKVIDEENPALTKARISLITAVRIVLAETLDLIGVSAPSKM